MAARAGAARVTTCEQVAAIAEAAAEIVRLNGFADRVHVVAKRSNRLLLGVDLPKRADLLISEVLSDKLLGEGVLRSTADARRRLLASDAVVIPRAVAAVARLVGGPYLQSATSVGTVAGFDLAPFNRFAPSAISISMEAGQIKDLSQDVEVFRFDLMQVDHRPEEKTIEFTARRAGTCVGLLQWLRLDLDDETVVENRPSERVKPSAWRQVVHAFPRPIALKTGQRLAVRAKHDLTNLIFAPVEAADERR
jgi:type II protein arginine methyltransferase